MALFKSPYSAMKQGASLDRGGRREVLSVTGENSKTIRWVAFVRMIEVRG